MRIFSTMLLAVLAILIITDTARPNGGGVGRVRQRSVFRSKGAVQGVQLQSYSAPAVVYQQAPVVLQQKFVKQSSAVIYQQPAPAVLYQQQALQLQSDYCVPAAQFQQYAAPAQFGFSRSRSVQRLRVTGGY